MRDSSTHGKAAATATSNVKIAIRLLRETAKYVAVVRSAIGKNVKNATEKM
jgi:hypothetical protein